MTNQEFWKLKVGDYIYDDYGERKVKIIKREVLDEVIGFVISKHHTTDIYNGRKYVQLETIDQQGWKWYYDSTRKDKLKYLTKV